MFRDLTSKDCVYCVDIEIEIVEDSTMIDSDETNIEQVNESLIGIIPLFNFSQFSPHSNAFSYLQNIYKIYLGRNTSPP